MASSLALRRHISDIIECPICLEVLHTPTSLPCLHTFCLRCLRSTFTTDYPGDVAACPVCRQDFHLPSGGLAALPKNFTLNGLVELQSTTTTRMMSASACVAVMQTANDNKSSQISNDRICHEESKPAHSEMTNDVTLQTRDNDTPAAEAASGNTPCI